MKVKNFNLLLVVVLFCSQTIFCGFSAEAFAKLINAKRRIAKKLNVKERLSAYRLNIKKDKVDRNLRDCLQKDEYVRSIFPFIGVAITWTFGAGVAITYFGAKVVGLIGLGFMISHELGRAKNAFIPDKSRARIDEVLKKYKAPGEPTGADGFKPPKKGDGRKVKVQKGKLKGEYGWRDKKGNIWVPAGSGGHGGDEWDVQNPKGENTNVYPGGKVRGKDNRK